MTPRRLLDAVPTDRLVRVLAHPLAPAAVTVWLAVKIALFLRQPACEPLRQLAHPEFLNLVTAFVLLPLHAFNVVWFLAVFGALRWAVDGSRATIRPARLTGHPAPALLAGGLLAGVAFSLAPWWPLEIFFTLGRYAGGEQAQRVSDPAWLRFALWHAAGLALFFGALAAGPQRRWVTVPFLVLPFSVFGAVPALWWLGAADLFPSRFGRRWAGALLALTMLPVLAQLSTRLDLGHPLPVYAGGDAQVLPTLGFRNAYGVARVPERPELWAVFREHLTHTETPYTDRAKLCRFDGRSVLRWEPAGCVELEHEWNEASFDFAKDRAYVFVAQTETLHTIDLNALTPVAAVAYRHGSTEFALPALQALSPDGATLYVAASHTLRAIATDTGVVRQTIPLDDPGRPVALTVSPVTGEPILPFSGFTLVLDPATLAPRARHRTPGPVGGFCWDDRDHALWLALPDLMETRRLNLDSGAFDRAFPAPVGVRALAIDPQRRWLFQASMSGVVRVVDLNTGEALRRSLLAPFIHGLAAFPETGELLVSVGGNRPLMWRYFPPRSTRRLSELVYRAVEGLVALGFRPPAS